mgnify:CR=1 FL=1
MSKVQVDTIDTRSGTSTMQIGSTNTSTINIGVSGDTVNIPSGVTIANAGTATGFGGSNEPNFHAYSSSDQVFARNTSVLLKFDAETFDTASAYNNTASNYKFVAPSAGKYFINSQAFFMNNDAVYIVQCFLYIYKNGSEVIRAGFDANNATVMRKNIVKCNTLLNLAQNDYIQMYGFCETAGGSDDVQISGATEKTFFEGFKLV